MKAAFQSLTACFPVVGLCYLLLETASLVRFLPCTDGVPAKCGGCGVSGREWFSICFLLLWFSIQKIGRGSLKYYLLVHLFLCLWESEVNFQESFLPPHGSQGMNTVVRLGSKCLYPLSYLVAWKYHGCSRKCFRRGMGGQLVAVSSYWPDIMLRATTNATFSELALKIVQQQKNMSFKKLI